MKDCLVFANLIAWFLFSQVSQTNIEESAGLNVFVCAWFMCAVYAIWRYYNAKAPKQHVA